MSVAVFGVSDVVMNQFNYCLFLEIDGLWFVSSWYCLCSRGREVGLAIDRASTRQIHLRLARNADPERSTYCCKERNGRFTT